MSRDAAVTMGIGGAVRMRGYYDWGGAIPAPAFAPYLIPIPAQPTDRRQFGTTPAGTCLYFRILGQHRLLSAYQLYIEANFTGYQHTDFKLKKAYAMFGNITFGLASSTFSDGAAQVPMVDSNGPSNSITPTSVLIRYMPVIKKRWVLAVSVEDPTTKKQIGYIEGKTAKVNNWLPDAAAFVQYQWGPTSHIRLSGLLRNLSYRNLVQQKNHNVTGWALQLSGTGHPLPQITTYVTGNYGRGYSSLCGDLHMGDYDLENDPKNPGLMYAPYSMGWNLGVQYHFLPNLFSCVGFGETRYLPRHNADGSEYKYGLLGMVNLFWSPTPRTQFAVEFDWGRRKNFDGSAKSARRIGLMGQFSF